MPDQAERYHIYHAEAGVLHARLQLPLAQDIHPQAFTKLPERGGYLSQHAHNFQVEGVVSYRTAYTQVAGNRDVKAGHGWSTVATAAVEGLNVLDVVTADRVVAQVSTEHPLVGYVPHITFLGTRFENLRIAGHKVDVDLDHDFVGARPKDDSPYTGIKKLIDRIAGQSKEIEGLEPFPDEELADFHGPLTPVPGEDDGVENTGFKQSIEGSLVSRSKLDQADNSYPGRCFGKVIHVPNFGTIYLATVHIRHSKFKDGVPKKTEVDLQMMKIKMGCIAAGAMAIGSTRVNAGSHP
jgi:hypothetical protein